MTTFGPPICGIGLSCTLNTCVYDRKRSERMFNAIITIIGFSLGTLGDIVKETGYFRRDNEKHIQRN